MGKLAHLERLARAGEEPLRKDGGIRIGEEVNVSTQI